ncbi:hypothetical protein D3C86_1215980 [compost metagenome]
MLLPIYRCVTLLAVVAEVDDPDITIPLAFTEDVPVMAERLISQFMILSLVALPVICTPQP